mmetsp:Transcript_23149/g.68219  ORF Transcript_23149/g.68219 Transcript_23149/m.68219 type:complete len:323 (+) Transcript_23149:575-1543(+)
MGPREEGPGALHPSLAEVATHDQTALTLETAGFTLDPAGLAGCRLQGCVPLALEPAAPECPCRVGAKSPRRGRGLARRAGGGRDAPRGEEEGQVAITVGCKAPRSQAGSDERPGHGRTGPEAAALRALRRGRVLGRARRWARGAGGETAVIREGACRELPTARTPVRLWRRAAAGPAALVPWCRRLAPDAVGQVGAGQGIAGDPREALCARGVVGRAQVPHRGQDHCEDLGSGPQLLACEVRSGRKGQPAEHLAGPRHRPVTEQARARGPGPQQEHASAVERAAVGVQLATRLAFVAAAARRRRAHAADKGGRCARGHHGSI